MAKKILLTLMMAITLIMAGSAAKIDGKWKTSMESPDGSMDIFFTFKVDGVKLTGTITSPIGEMEIKNGKVNGDEFSFDMDMGGNVIPHKCKVEGEVIKVKFEMGDMGGGDRPNEFILKKVE